MKVFSLLLPLVATLLLHGSAFAQALAGSAQSLRGSLADLSTTLRGDDTREAANSIARARENLRIVQSQAEQGFPKEAIANNLQAARVNTSDALRRLDGRRLGGDGPRFAGDVRARLDRLDSSWSVYGDERPHRGGGGGYYPQPVPVPGAGYMTDERAQGLAARELASNLRVSAGAVTITRLERDGGHYRAYGVVRGAGRYLVDLDAISGRIFSVKPLR